jgi:uncharacterized protein (UPF0333 family)
MAKHKAQASFEYMILLSLFLMVLGIMVFYSSEQITNYIKYTDTGTSAKTVARTVDQVAAGGPGTLKIVAVTLPKGVLQGYTTYNQITYISIPKDTISHTHFASKVPIFGFLEVTSGKKYIIVKAEDNGYVSLTPLGTPNILKNLVALYNFESLNSTHTRDASGKSPNGKFENYLRCNNIGFIGKGCEFNKTASQYITFGNDSSFNFNDGSFTICAWFKTRSTGEELFIFSKRDSVDNLGYGLRVNTTTGKMIANIKTDIEEKIFQSASSVYNNGEWHHVCYVYDLDMREQYLMINGKSDSFTTTLSGSYSSIADFEIGRGYSGYNFNGTIDEVILWNRALNDIELRRLFIYGGFRYD